MFALIIMALCSTAAATTDRARPNQPRKFVSPARSFRTKQKKRKFQVCWFEEWKWLDYIEADDSVRYHYCSTANQRNLLQVGLFNKREASFITKGYSNWKDTCSSFMLVIISN